MSVTVSLKDRNDKSYGIYILVPEAIIEATLKRGISPKNFLTKLVEKIYFEYDLETLFAYTYDISNSLPLKRKREAIAPVKDFFSTWDYSKFDMYMNRLLIQIDSRTSDIDLLIFLNAYNRLGPRPTSEMLRKVMSSDSGDIWYERLRVLKARLTILAKHMGLGSFFLRAYGSGMLRKHPIDNEFYSFMQEWFKENKLILNKYIPVT